MSPDYVSDISISKMPGRGRTDYSQIIGKYHQNIIEKRNLFKQRNQKEPSKIQRDLLYEKYKLGINPELITLKEKYQQVRDLDSLSPNII